MNVQGIEVNLATLETLQRGLFQQLYKPLVNRMDLPDGSLSILQAHATANVLSRHWGVQNFVGSGSIIWPLYRPDNPFWDDPDKGEWMSHVRFGFKMPSCKFTMAYAMPELPCFVLCLDEEREDAWIIDPSGRYAYEYAKKVGYVMEEGAVPDFVAFSCNENPNHYRNMVYEPKPEACQVATATIRAFFSYHNIAFDEFVGEIDKFLLQCQ